MNGIANIFVYSFSCDKTTLNLLNRQKFIQKT